MSNARKSADQLLLEAHGNRPATIAAVVAAVEPVIEGHHENSKRIAALEAGSTSAVGENAIVSIKIAIETYKAGTLALADLPHLRALDNAYRAAGLNPERFLEEFNRD
jgi:hypothetical protein